ncbi:hypothetical protein D3C86_1447280 [compost metagenome]
MIGRYIAVQFKAVEWIVGFNAGLLPCSNAGVRLRLILELRKTEEEQSVANDRTTRFNGDVRGVTLVESISLRERVRRLAAEAVRGPVAAQGELELIRPRLGDRVDDTAGSTTKFGSITASFDFNRAVEVERNR